MACNGASVVFGCDRVINFKMLKNCTVPKNYHFNLGNVSQAYENKIYILIMLFESVAIYLLIKVKGAGLICRLNEVHRKEKIG